MTKDKNNKFYDDTIVEDFELLDDIPTLTSLANDKENLHDYNKNCTCINCCAHRVIEATSNKSKSPRITQTRTRSKITQEGIPKPKKEYGSGIKMDNVKFTNAWDDWEIE